MMKKRAKTKRVPRRMEQMKRIKAKKAIKIKRPLTKKMGRASSVPIVMNRLQRRMS
jgi:hypothetical protein